MDAKFRRTNYLLLLSIVLAALSLFLAGCGNKRIKEVDSKIEYFEGRFELVDEKINNFVPEIYSAEAGLEKVDELSEENGNLADEVMNYVKLLLALQNKNPNRKHYTREQMDKLLLLGRRAQKNYDVLINYIVRINNRLHM